MPKVKGLAATEKQRIMAEKAHKLYMSSLSLREVASIMGKSYEWVRGAVDKYELDKTKAKE